MRSRQFWLKSTNTRSPRSSFHHFVVTPSSRRSSARPKPIAACRTSTNVPLRPDPQVDVDAAVAGGLREAHQPELVEQFPGHPGDAGGVAERGAGLRVEVDAQLVGAVDVGAPDRPRVERQRAHLRAPHGHGDLGRADLGGLAARGERDVDALHVVGRALREPLLVERVGLLPGPAGGELDAGTDAGGPAFQRGGPVAQRTHQPVLHLREVLRDHQLGDGGRPVGGLVDDPVRAGHAHGAPSRLDLDGGRLRHPPTLVVDLLSHTVCDLAHPSGGVRRSQKPCDGG